MLEHSCSYRYEDNGDAVNNLVVITKQTGNKSIEDFGSPDKWLQDNAKLLGEDVWKGVTVSLVMHSGRLPYGHLDFIVAYTVPCAWLGCHFVKLLSGIAGLSRSEGGFKENKVSSASVLDVQAANDKKGKPYYKYEILTRTGTHHADS